MPDYIYLLENRLSVAQQNALRTVRDLAREAQMTVFLTGGRSARSHLWKPCSRF